MPSQLVGSAVRRRPLPELHRALARWAGRSVLVVATVLSLPLPAHAGEAREYDLKAAYLYRFVQFISWPENAFPDPGSPFVVGILGPDPFAGSLDAILDGEHVGRRPIVLERYTDASEVSTCHLLYLSDAAAESIERALAQLRRPGLITVGDSAVFAQRGGAIGFAGDADRINLVINTASGRDAGVVFSSKLLHLAEKVEGLP